MNNQNSKMLSATFDYSDYVSGVGQLCLWAMLTVWGNCSLSTAKFSPESAIKLECTLPEKLSNSMLATFLQDIRTLLRPLLKSVLLNIQINGKDISLPLQAMSTLNTYEIGQQLGLTDSTLSTRLLTEVSTTTQPSSSKDDLLTVEKYMEANRA